MWLLFSACTSAPAPGPLLVDDADRALVLTVQDLADRAENVVIERGVENWTKTRDDVGNIELKYEFERRAGRGDPLFVGSYVWVQHDPSTSAFAFDAAVDGMVSGFGSIDARRRDEVLTLAERRECYALLVSGYDVGTSCVVEQNERVALWMISGTHAFSTDGAMDPILGPDLPALAGYIPTGAAALPAR